MKTNKYFIFLFLTLLFSCSKYEIDEPTSNLKVVEFQDSQSKLSSNQNLPINLPNDFIFGVNGSPVGQEIYKDDISINKQYELINEHNFDYYRFPINYQTLAPLYYLNIASVKSFLLNHNVLPVLNDVPDFTLDEDQNYQSGFLKAKRISEYLGNSINYYEVGNELDIMCLINEKDGNLPTDYDYEKIQKTASFLNGMISGIKTNNSHAKIIINYAGWLHYEYFNLLISEGVQFDILGCHWYSTENLNLCNNCGTLTNPRIPSDPKNINVMRKLENFRKPIWITEFNIVNGHSNYLTSTEKEYLTTFINELSGHPQFKALFFYELFDNWKIPFVSEQKYGLKNYQTGSYNVISEVAKFKVEEFKNGYSDYIFNVYSKILKRQNQFIYGYDYWTNNLKRTKNKINTVKGIMDSDEAYYVFIDQQFYKLLDRHVSQTDPSVIYWRNRLKTDLTREQMIVLICDSPEFWSKSGYNNIGFIDRIYLKLLNRSRDTDFWLTYLNSNSSQKASVVNAILHSDEFYQNFVTKQYFEILDRSVVSNDPGLVYWISRMKTDTNQKDLIINFTTGNEFYENSIKNGYQRYYNNLFPTSTNTYIFQYL